MPADMCSTDVPAGQPLFEINVYGPFTHIAEDLRPSTPSDKSKMFPKIAHCADARACQHGLRANLRRAAHGTSTAACVRVRACARACMHTRSLSFACSCMRACATTWAHGAFLGACDGRNGSERWNVVGEGRRIARRARVVPVGEVVSSNQAGCIVGLYRFSSRAAVPTKAAPGSNRQD